MSTTLAYAFHREQNRTQAPTKWGYLDSPHNFYIVNFAYNSSELRRGHYDYLKQYVVPMLKRIRKDANKTTIKLIGRASQSGQGTPQEFRNWVLSKERANNVKRYLNAALPSLMYPFTFKVVPAGASRPINKSKQENYRDRSVQIVVYSPVTIPKNQPIKPQIKPQIKPSITEEMKRFIVNAIANSHLKYTSGYSCNAYVCSLGWSEWVRKQFKISKNYYDFCCRKGNFSSQAQKIKYFVLRDVKQLIRKKSWKVSHKELVALYDRWVRSKR